jgi:hypothetical protein
VTGTTDPLTVNGGSGTNTLNVDADGPGASSAVVTQPGRVISDYLTVNFSGVRTINLNNTQTVNAAAGPNTKDRDAAFAGLNAQERVVQALYLDALGRAGSQAELDGWLGIFNGAGGQQAAAAGIEGSFEARDHLVQSWYQTYLGRPANGNEELGWVSLLQAGQSEEQVLSQLLGSAEFHDRAQSMGLARTADQNYVQALYQALLGRTAGEAEVGDWVNALPQMGRQGVALAMLHGQEFRTYQFEGYYNALLHRPNDSAGLNGWVMSNLDMHSVRIGFEGGPEFFANG